MSKGKDKPELDADTVAEITGALKLACETLYVMGPYMPPRECRRVSVVLVVLTECSHSVAMCQHHYSMFEHAMLDPECAGARCNQCGVPSPRVRLEKLE